MTLSYPYNFDGFCDICEEQVEFSAQNHWFRDFLTCTKCHSVPRERALMRAMAMHVPNYRALKIHESSPVGRGVSKKLSLQCKGYSYSHFFPDVKLGKSHKTRKERCENLEQLTFPDNTFDIFITQDVMEHVLDPEAAFSEIARVLKPGGIHAFTVPLVNKCSPTSRRAIKDGESGIQHLKEPEFHGNPIDDQGSLVTVDWGYDIIEFIKTNSGLSCQMITMDEIERGIRAEFIEVLICTKQKT